MNDLGLLFNAPMGVQKVSGGVDLFDKGNSNREGLRLGETNTRNDAPVCLDVPSETETSGVQLAQPMVQPREALTVIRGSHKYWGFGIRPVPHKGHRDAGSKIVDRDIAKVPLANDCSRMDDRKEGDGKATDLFLREDH